MGHANRLPMGLGQAFLRMFLFASVWARSEAVKIEIQRLLVPAVGLRESDFIQIVADGKLPNACYSLDKTESEVDLAHHRISIRQNAQALRQGICATPQLLPADHKTPIPFSVDVNLGSLPAGKYTVAFSSPDGPRTRDFTVEALPDSGQDFLRYAAVMSVSTKDFVMASERKIEAELVFQINSSCSTVSDQSAIQYQDGVIFLTPEIVQDPNTLCLPVSRYVNQTFFFDNPGPGRHLIYVRSLGGLGKTKIFSVL